MSSFRLLAAICQVVWRCDFHAAAMRCALRCDKTALEKVWLCVEAAQLCRSELFLPSSWRKCIAHLWNVGNNSVGCRCLPAQHHMLLWFFSDLDGLCLHVTQIVTSLKMKGAHDRQSRFSALRQLVAVIGCGLVRVMQNLRSWETCAVKKVIN